MNKNSIKTNENEGFLPLYFKNAEKYPLLSEEEEYKTALMAKNGDKKAKEKLITSNIRFVISTSKKYTGRGLGLEELVQEGCTGLSIAVDKFDPEKGYKFISYAIWWIKQAMQYAISVNNHAIRLPLNKSNDFIKLTKAKEELLRSDPDHEPTTEELSEKSSLKEKDIKTLELARGEVVSFDEKINTKEGENSSSRGDNYEDISVNVEEEGMRTFMSEDIDALMKSVLSERERGILRMYFGFDDGKESSYQKVGDKFGLTKERIRQIINSSKEKLKKAGDSIGLWDYYTLAS